VPVWRIILSDPLAIAALVSRYLPNKLMARRPLQMRQLINRGHLSRTAFRQRGSSGINPPFGGLFQTSGQVIHALLTRAPLSLPEGNYPFDLHVLSTPPAFVLSQDQTLQLYFLITVA
jgi:hypothetical protein